MRTWLCLLALGSWLVASLPNGLSTAAAVHGMLQIQNATPPATLTLPSNRPLTTTPSTPTLVPIPGTNIVLGITYIGPSWFRPTLLENLLAGAYNAILTPVADRPDEPVVPLPWFHQCASESWHDTIAMRVRGSEGNEGAFTWRRLYWVLAGLLQFMLGGELRQLHPLNFDVNVVGEGTVAVGLLWYSQRPLVGGKEAEGGGVMG